MIIVELRTFKLLHLAIAEELVAMLQPLVSCILDAKL